MADFRQVFVQRLHGLPLLPERLRDMTHDQLCRRRPLELFLK
jgi:hypothetical protein